MLRRSSLAMVLAALGFAVSANLVQQHHAMKVRHVPVRWGGRSGSKRHGPRAVSAAALKRAARTRRNIRARASKRKAAR